MVVADDNARAEFPAHEVELIAEERHLIGVVLVAGDDLVNGVDHHGNEPLLRRAADELRGELVHRHGAAAQIPYFNVGQPAGRPPLRLVNVTEAVQTACPVELEIDVEHPSAGAGKPQPVAPLGNGDAQLDECKALSGLAGTRQQHFVALPEHSLDEARRERRHLVPYVGELLGVRQIVVDALDPLFPCVPIRLSDVPVHEKLLMSAAYHAGHTGEPGGVFVLRVDLQPVLLADLIEVIHTLPVLFVAVRVDAYDGVDTLSAGVYETRHRQLQLADDRVLAGEILRVALHERVAVGGHVVVLHALPVERVKADPRARLGVIVAEYRADVAVVAFQLADERSGGAVISALARQIPSVLLPDLRHIADVIVLMKERLEIVDDLPRRVPAVRLVEFLRFHPAALHHDELVAVGDLTVPVKRVILAGIRAPAVVLCHLHDRGDRHGCCAAAEALPLSRALPGVVPAVAAAPLLPYGAVAALVLERHANADPLRI